MKTKPTSALSASLCVGLASLSLCGCGQSAPRRRTAPVTPARTATHPRAAVPRPATPCLSAPRQAMARFLGVAPGRITLAASIGNNSMPQCTFGARLAGHARVQPLANVNDGPQPYFVLERAAIEAAQQFTVSRMIAAPQAVTGWGSRPTGFRPRGSSWPPTDYG